MPLNKRRAAFEYQLVSQESDIFGKIFDHTPIPILVINSPGDLLKVNAAGLQLIKTRRLDVFLDWFKGNAQKLLGDFNWGDSFLEHEIVVKDSNKKSINLLVRVKSITKKQLIITLQDITARKMAEKRLTRLAQRDGLTGLLNHNTIMMQLQQELSRAKRYHLPLACLLIDVDNFKKSNDKLGHLKGDQILKKIAKALKVNLRETDLIGRYGGDEFLIILTETPLEEAHIPARRIQHYLSHHQPIRQHDLLLTLSIGISGFTGKGTAISTRLITNADKALYFSKKQGGNKIVLSNRVIKNPEV